RQRAGERAVDVPRRAGLFRAGTERITRNQPGDDGVERARLGGTQRLEALAGLKRADDRDDHAGLEQIASRDKRHLRSYVATTSACPRTWSLIASSKSARVSPAFNPGARSSAYTM